MSDVASSALSADEVAAVIRRLSYKPGYELSGSWDGAVLIVRLAVAGDSSTQVGHGIDLVQRAVFDATALDMGNVVSAVRQVVAEFEAHEAAEWLKLDGRPVLDPHSERVTWDDFASELPTLRREREARSQDRSP